jgi:hypothetical protein
MGRLIASSCGWSIKATQKRKREIGEAKGLHPIGVGYIPVLSRDLITRNVF